MLGVACPLLYLPQQAIDYAKLLSYAHGIEHCVFLKETSMLPILHWCFGQVHHVVAAYHKLDSRAFREGFQQRV